MSKLGNYNWNYCDKHGRYGTVPGGNQTCPKCLEEKVEKQKRKQSVLEKFKEYLNKIL